MIGSGSNQVDTQLFSFGGPEDPFELRSGEHLDQVTVAYETYGRLNGDASNAILLFHAITGSQHAAGFNATGPQGLRVTWNEECRLGWWSAFIGPGKALDTDRFYIVCANYLGGCYGSDWAGLPRPPERRTIRVVLSQRVVRRHGRQPGAVARPPWNRQAPCCSGRLDGWPHGDLSGNPLPGSR